MPRNKDRSLLKPELHDIEERYRKALKGLQDGTFKSLQQATTSYGLPKSSLGHRRNGRQSRQKAHEADQLLSPSSERAIVRWVLKLDDFGFPPRVDRLCGGYDI